MCDPPNSRLRFKLVLGFQIDQAPPSTRKRYSNVLVPGLTPEIPMVTSPLLTLSSVLLVVAVELAVAREAVLENARIVLGAGAASVVVSFTRLPANARLLLPLPVIQKSSG